MADDGDGENGGALLSDPVDVVIDKLLRYGKLSLCSFFAPGCAGIFMSGRVCWIYYWLILWSKNIQLLQTRNGINDRHGEDSPWEQ